MKVLRTVLTVFLILTGSVCVAGAVPSMDLGQVVVTASRMAQHDYKIASDVTVIDQETIKASTAQTVNEILEEQLGVNIYDNSTYKTSTVDIRGFGDTANRNVLVLVNDRKVNSIDISGPDLLQIPLDSVERMEIVRGAGSVLYGDNAVGGVINIITKKGKGDLSAKFGGSYGSYDSYGEDMELSGVFKQISYYLHSKYYETGGYRSNSDLLTKDFNARLGYKISEKIKIDLSTSWHEDDYGMPGGLNATELADRGRRGSADEDDLASTKDRYVQLSLDVAPWPENIDWGRFVVNFSYRNRDTYAMFASFGEFATKRTIDTIGLTGKYIFDQTIFNKQFNFVTGIDYYNVDNDIIGSGFNTDDLTIAKEEFGIYQFAEYEVVDHVYVNGGTRYQKAYYTFDQRNGSRNYEKKSPDESVSMVGAKYEYASRSNVFFNVQQTFRFLATDEWYDTWNGLNTDLDQQTGIQYEIGLKHSFENMLELSVTPYLIDIKKEIFFDPSAGNFGFGSNNNYEKTRRVGVEVGHKIDLLNFVAPPFVSKLNFFANYTAQEPQFNGGNNDDKIIPMVPQHQVNTGLNMQVLDKYNLSFTGRYVGARYAINDTLNETSMIKPYFILDSKLAYEIDNFKIFVSVNNIFDEKYYSYVSKSTTSTAKDYFPAPERNFNFGVSVKY